eukprot:m.6445 g.6445  ORF g.6445 m.6445 type:complete len:57 (-) comp2614_c0_seq1:173-343(-)
MRYYLRLHSWCFLHFYLVQQVVGGGVNVCARAFAHGDPPGNRPNTCMRPQTLASLC